MGKKWYAMHQRRVLVFRSRPDRDRYIRHQYNDISCFAVKRKDLEGMFPKQHGVDAHEIVMERDLSAKLGYTPKDTGKKRPVTF